MQGVYTIRSRVTGGTQFDATNPIVTFIEFATSGGLNNAAVLPPSITARILGFAYNSQGAAHDVLLTLRPPSNTVPNADDQIILRSESGINNFAEVCGPDGLVVPREFGISASNQQPPTSTIATAGTYRVYFSTTSKAADATFFLWYRIDEVQK